MYSISYYVPRSDSEHHVRSYGGDDHVTGEFGIINCLLGGLGKDVLLGADGNDYIRGDVDDQWRGVDFEGEVGRAGNDILKGGAGSDRLGGDGGHDKLYGEEGEDIVYGGYGDDILHGGFMDGSDTLNGGSDSFDLVENLQLILDEKKGETLIHKVSNQLGSELFYRGDTVTYEDYLSSPDANGVTTTVTPMNMNMNMNGVRIKLNDDGSNDVTMFVSGHVGVGDVLSNIENLIGTTSHNDTLIGNDHDNILEGLGGADFLNGDDGSDTASYKSSNAGVMVELDANGNGIGTGGHAAGDILRNIENLIGSEHNDKLTGNNKDNILLGLGGNDMFIGGGGLGIDTFVGGAGMDTVDFSGAAGAVSLTLGDSDRVGTGSIDNGGSFYLYGVENIMGTSAGDTITGNAEDNILEGGDSIDHLFGAAGNDELHGGADKDVLSGGAGDDKYFFMYGTGSVAVDVIQGENTATGRNKIIFDYRDETEASLMNLKFEFSRVDGNGNIVQNGAHLSIQAVDRLPGMFMVTDPDAGVHSRFRIEGYFVSSDDAGDFSIHLMYEGGALEYGTVDAAANMNFADISAF